MTHFIYRLPCGRIPEAWSQPVLGWLAMAGGEESAKAWEFLLTVLPLEFFLYSLYRN